MDEIEKNNLTRNAKTLGEYLKEKLKTIKNVKKIKGKGLILGLEVEGNIQDIIKKCRDKGLLILSAGLNTIRLLPPLIITKEETDMAFDILAEVIG